MHSRIKLLVLATLVWVAVVAASPAGAFADLPSPWGAVDDIGGVTPARHVPSGIVGHFSLPTDTDDVLKQYVFEGERLQVAVLRDSGTGVQLYLYPPGTTTVNQAGGAVAQATASPSDPDLLLLEYIATTTGWYYLDVNVPADGLEGDYTIWYSCEWKDDETGVYDNDNPPGLYAWKPPIYGLVDHTIDPDDLYYVRLYAGENLTAKLVEDEEQDGWEALDLDLYLYKPGAPSAGPDANDWIVGKSAKRGSSSERISFTPSSTGVHSLDIFAFAGGGEYKVTYACLTKPNASSKLRAGSTYKITSWLYPKRTAGTKPVTIVCQRIKSGKVVATKTFSAKASTDGGSSKCTASVKLTRGTWRLKAKRTDSVLGTFYSGSKTVTVK